MQIGEMSKKNYIEYESACDAKTAPKSISHHELPLPQYFKKCKKILRLFRQKCKTPVDCDVLYGRPLSERIYFSLDYSFYE